MESFSVRVCIVGELLIRSPFEKSKPIFHDVRIEQSAPQPAIQKKILWREHSGSAGSGGGPKGRSVTAKSNSPGGTKGRSRIDPVKKGALVGLHTFFTSCFWQL
jgi:hypothetical protein